MSLLGVKVGRARKGKLAIAEQILSSLLGIVLHGPTPLAMLEEWDQKALILVLMELCHFDDASAPAEEKEPVGKVFSYNKIIFRLGTRKSF
jgi:hypothetical protein